MRLIKTAQHSEGSVNFYLPSGKYAGLFVRLAGTNAGGATLGVTELGTLKIQHFNDERVNIAPDHLISLTNLYGGVPESASAVGAAYTYSFVVPFYRKKDRNNALIVTANRTQFTLSGFNTAKVAAGTIEVYALFSDAPQQYLPTLKSVDFPIAAASTVPYEFPENNISSLYVVSDAAILSMQVNVDKDVKVDGTFAAIDAYSDAVNLVETGITFVEVLAPKSELISESINSKILVISRVSGAVTIRFAYFGISLIAR